MASASSKGVNVDLSSECVKPLSPVEVAEWFDLDGRLVKEAAMRKGLYEGKHHVPNVLTGILCIITLF